jgi:hypothetical protein
MIFNSSNYEDIHKYYRHTYVKFPETGDTLYLIDTVSQREVSGTTENGDRFVLFLSDKEPYLVNYVLPKKSYFQFDKNACLLYRLPQRQYSRGLSKENTSIMYMGTTGKFDSVSPDFSLLRAYVNKPSFPTLNEAVANKGRCDSIALAPRFAYAPRTKTIYVDMQAIGTVNTEKKQIELLYPLFKNEVLALAKGSIFEGKVV